MIYLRVKAVELASMSLILRRGKGESRDNPRVIFKGICCLVRTFVALFKSIFSQFLLLQSNFLKL